MLCGLLISVAACETRPPPVALCGSFRPIYVAEHEINLLSRETKLKIATHNRTYERLCPQAAAPVLKREQQA